MTTSGRTRPIHCITLSLIAVLFIAASIVGITWGLPSRKIDNYLFGGGEVWSGEKIYRLANAGEKLAPDRAARTGADVDVDPLNAGKAADDPIPLTATDEDTARIYLRYRLYTYQPDEMITMMALAGMRPSQMQLDPRLYQYGGLFIYPVGALIKLCGLLGLIDVRGDVVYYLDHPDEFGKFYIVARAYSAAWGLLGVVLVYGIARRLSWQYADCGPQDPDSKVNRPSTIDNRQCENPLAPACGSGAAHRAGLLAALLFTLMPVVVCMSHEGKPHLPGAVLMLAAVYFAIRCVPRRDGAPERYVGNGATGSAPTTLRDPGPSANRQSTIDNRQSFWWMCVCCGAAVGMVLSSWPICILIPLVAWLRACPPLGKAELEVRGGKLENGGGRRVRFLSSLFSLRTSMLGLLLAVAVYFVTNPYVLINAFVNRDVLRSNFGNSLAMYQIARVGGGFARVLELTIEGATLPVLVLGLIAFAVAAARRRFRADPAVWVLVVPAAVFFFQFVAIGAGKPAEYGRFGVFTNTALAIGAATVLNAQLLRRHWFTRWVFPALAIAWMAAFGGGYLRNFHADTTDRASRVALAEHLAAELSGRKEPDERPRVAVFAEPAPYGCPPLNFAASNVVLVKSTRQIEWVFPDQRCISIRAVDTNSAGLTNLGASLYRALAFGEGLRRETPISWANKPFQSTGIGEPPHN